MELIISNFLKNYKFINLSDELTINEVIQKNVSLCLKIGN